jgi:hypothetical protein
MKTTKEKEWEGMSEIFKGIMERSYKGGRNECFAYGTLKNTRLYDYDLSNAYTTGLAMVGVPRWDRVKEFKEEKELRKRLKDIMGGYVIVDIIFEFPIECKYPNLPVLVTPELFCYPLKGETVVGGPEILAALNRGVKIVKIKNAFYIPFMKEKEEELENEIKDTNYNEKDNDMGLEVIKKYDIIKPFFEPISILQKERTKYKKDTVENHIIKLILNSIYGMTASGINPKSRFNTKTGENEVGFYTSKISCPLTASFTTSIVRGVIAEIIYKIESKNGMLLSVTTDGWITDLKKEEMYALKEAGEVTKLFAKSRYLLSGTYDFYELKHECVGITNITVRGQIALTEDALLAFKAMTGFQSIY